MDARYRRHMLCRQQLPEGVAILRLLVLPGCYVRSVRINIIFAGLFNNTWRCANPESAAGEQPADVASDAAGKDQDRAEVRPDVVAVDRSSNERWRHQDQRHEDHRPTARARMPPRSSPARRTM
jgi:hypothetical protein